MTTSRFCYDLKKRLAMSGVVIALCASSCSTQVAGTASTIATTRVNRTDVVAAATEIGVQTETPRRPSEEPAGQAVPQPVIVFQANQTQMYWAVPGLVGPQEISANVVATNTITTVSTATRIYIAFLEETRRGNNSDFLLKILTSPATIPPVFSTVAEHAVCIGVARPSAAYSLIASVDMAWSSDGSKLAFRACDNRGYPGQLHYLTISDMKIRPVALGSRVLASGAAWSPSNLQLAFSTKDDPGSSTNPNTHLVLFDLNSSVLDEIKAPLDMVEAPQWISPSRLLVLESLSHTGQERRAWVLDVAARSEINSYRGEFQSAAADPITGDILAVSAQGAILKRSDEVDAREVSDTYSSSVEWLAATQGFSWVSPPDVVTFRSSAGTLSHIMSAATSISVSPNNQLFVLYGTPYGLPDETEKAPLTIWNMEGQEVAKAPFAGAFFAAWLPNSAGVVYSTANGIYYLKVTGEPPTQLMDIARKAPQAWSIVFWGSD